MTTLEESQAALEHDHSLRRRDFINIAAVSFAGVGAVAVALPLVSQMSPSADVLALASTEVDISKVLPGQAIKTSWRKQPVFIRNLTPKEIAEANAVDMDSLRDPQSLAERTKPGKQNWLITLGVCTHLGCIPLGIGGGENREPIGRTRARQHQQAAGVLEHRRDEIAPRGALAELGGVLGECGTEGRHRLRVKRAAGGVLDREPVAAEKQHRLHAGAAGEALDHRSQLDHGVELRGRGKRCAT